MKSLDQLERDAEDQRVLFEASLGALRKRLTLRGLADEAAALADPAATRLVPAYAAVKRHPLAAAAVLAGAGWLFKQAVDRGPRRKANGRRIAS
jgi:hypothetical protein